MILACVGAEPVILPVPGAEKPHVHWAPDAELGRVPCGEEVVVVGGGPVGTEASLTLAMEGKRVTVLEMAEKVDLMKNGSFGDLERMSAEQGITRLLGWRLLEIGDREVLAENAAGERKTIPADTVLMAVGLRPRAEDALRFAHACPESGVYIVGDAAASGDIRDAVFQAFEAARAI